MYNIISISEPLIFGSICKIYETLILQHFHNFIDMYHIYSQSFITHTQPYTFLSKHVNCNPHFESIIH